MLDYVIDNEDLIEEKCTYNLVIHKNAECWQNCVEDFVTYIQTLKDINYYYIILHNKQENGITEEHYHLIICYSRKTKFSKIRKDFPGGHIEETGNKQASIQYLVHRTAKAKEQNKETYNYSDIVTNNDKDKQKFIDCDNRIACADNGTFYQSTNEICAILTDNNLLADYNLSTNELIKKYGSKQVKQRMSVIIQLRKEYLQNIDKAIQEENLQVAVENTRNTLINEYELKMQNLEKEIELLKKLVDTKLPF